METVRVDLGSRGYDVFVGPGAIDALGGAMPATAKRAAVVTQEGIPHAIDPGIDCNVFVIGDGERAKSLATIEELCEAFAAWGLTRNDVVIGLGGGVVTDVAGFAAASYHRGTPVVHVATTLLGQIDAAIGGKTGVNIAAGKNLVGAFWQPHGVICDTAMLATLPRREYRCGLGEMAKYHFIGGDHLDALSLEERVAACVQIKADVVAGDEREAASRAVLNYGHTLAHALEIAGDFDLRHGEAVAIGLIYAAEVARRLGRIDTPRVDLHRTVVGSYDLATAVDHPLDADQVLHLFSRDKKATDGITLVLDGPNGLESVTDIDADVLIDALAAVSSP